MHRRLSECREDAAWLVAGMEREGISRKAQERLLILLHQLVDGPLLCRAQLKSVLRIRVAAGLLQAGCAPSDVRRRLPALLSVSKRTAERTVTAALAQRTARDWASQGGADAV